MQQIRTAIRVGNATDLQRAAHTLKGSIRFFGAESAAEAALQLETMGRTRELLRVEDAWSVLINEMEQLKPQLKDLIER